MSVYWKIGVCLYAALLTALAGSAICVAQDLAIVGAKVYASPDAAPTAGTTILIQHGTITAVGTKVRIPAGVPQLPCAGCIVFAGFWNNHVHFMEPKWDDAAHLPAARLDQQMQQMITHSGFTTVVDTGSSTANTVALRRRIENGDMTGPRIYTSGAPLFPAHALPYYLAGLAPELRAQMGQPETPAAATAFVDANIAGGTDIVKLFTGSIVGPNRITPMSVPIARAAVEEAHRHHQLAFTHPSNLEGTQVALDSGVDVLAHAPELTGGMDDAFLNKLVAQHMAMIPTLMLFSQDSEIARIRATVLRFHQLGGVLMFGTDTGFLTDYSMEMEFRQLAMAGLSFRDILAMLTTAPARKFAVESHAGRVATGMDGDLTVLSADPSSGDATAFTQVRYTIRGGRILYRKPSAAKQSWTQKRGLKQ